MFKTILRQNIAVMVVTVITALLASFILMFLMIGRPQVEGVANSLIRTIDGFEAVSREMKPLERLNMLSQLHEVGGSNIRFSAVAPERGHRANTFLGRQVVRKLEEHYGPDGVMVDTNGAIWVLFDMPLRPVWLSRDMPPLPEPGQQLLAMVAVVLVLSLVGGVILQGRVTRPLKNLEQHVTNITPDRSAKPLDVTGPREIAAVADAFNQMIERLETAEGERALMLAGVSHDLRTPLTKLRLSIAMLKDSDTELLEGASRQIDRIEDMLVQFLDFARGFEAEEARDLTLSALLQSAVDHHGLNHNVTIQPVEHVVVSVKQAAMVRALGNLMVNANRYGASPITLGGQLSGQMLILEVSDAGEGIDPSQTATLLRPFARGSSARSGQGSGLGLAIVEQAVRAHNGTITFHKSATRFCARLALPQRTDRT